MTEPFEAPQVQPRHSGVGIASFVIALIVMILIVVVFVVAGAMEMSTPGGLDDESVEAGLIGIAIILLLVADLVAVGLGIGGLVQAGRKKLFAILGLVISAGMILATLALIAVGMSMA